MVVYSSREAARLLGVCARTLQRYRDAGQISFSQIGRKVLFSEQNIQDFLEAFQRPTILKKAKKSKWIG